MSQSYVIRVHRRDPSQPDGMEGTLIAVGPEGVEMFPFLSGAELLRLLAAADEAPGRAKPA